MYEYCYLLFALVRRYLSVPLVMAFQKHNPAVEYFNPILELAKDVGIIDKFQRRANPYADVRHVRPVIDEKLRVEHFLLLFMVLFCSTMMAFLVFVLENICHGMKSFLYHLVLNLLHISEYGLELYKYFD